MKKKRLPFSIILVVILLIAAGVGFKVYKKLTPLEVPACGYDVSTNKYGRYNNPTILPLEHKVFNAVVEEMRQNPLDRSVKSENLESEEALLPESKAFTVVADRFGLSYEDVRQIYRKVSINLLTRNN